MEFPNASEYSFNEKKSFHKTRDIVYIDTECVVFMFWRQSVQCRDSTTRLEGTIYGNTESEMFKLLIIMLT